MTNAIDINARVWETEDGEVVVWGTHDLEHIVNMVDIFYFRVMKLSQDEIDEMDITEENFKQGLFYWTDPANYDNEVWDTDSYGPVQKEDDWIPYFVNGW